jgi:cobalt-zinc-cadmium efflux system outer membrane protein
MVPWFRACSLVLLGLSFAIPLRAEGLLYFEEAARRTLAAHPDTRRLAGELEAARARAAGAQLGPALEAGAELENFAGTGSTQGIDAAELTLSLGSVIERGDKRAARIAAADRTLDLLTVEQRIAMLDRLAETGRRFVALAVVQERVAVARAALEQANTTLALIRPRVEAARSPRTELLNAEIERSRAEMELVAALREQVARQSALAGQWGAPQDRPVVKLALLELPLPSPTDELAAALAATPDLERYVSESRLAEARIELAKAQSVPDWRWELGVRRLEETDDAALVAGFSVPFGQARRAEPVLREQRAELARVEATAAARRIELEQLLVAEVERLHALRERVLAISGEQLPRAHEARELTERGYRIGRFAYRELALASEQVLVLELARIDAASQYHLSRIEIERLTGAQVGSRQEQK